MKLGWIAPLNKLYLALDGDLCLILPQFLNDRRYQEWVKECKKREQILMLDNGAFEDNIVTLGTLKRYAKKYGVDWVVLPDVIGDYDATVKASKEAVGEFGEYETVFVLHGKHPADSLTNYTRLVEEQPLDFDILAVSSAGWKLSLIPEVKQFIVDNGLDRLYRGLGRYWLIKAIQFDCPWKIHLFGLNIPFELTEKSIYSCDMSFPFTCAYHNKFFTAIGQSFLFANVPDRRVPLDCANINDEYVEATKDTIRRLVKRYDL